jgi:transcriptional regulator with XRE-family HTH domain
MQTTDPPLAPASGPVGEMLRHWRSARHRSQLDVSNDVGVSTRHLSCVETGKARPSPELVLSLAEHLEVPLRERNTLLAAAGYAPRYGERPLDDPALVPVIRSVQRMLDAHDPCPGVAVDRRWDVVLANDASWLLVAGLPDELLTPAPNVYRVCMHPEGLVARSPNPHEWVPPLLDQLRRSVRSTGDPALAELLSEVEAYPAAESQAGPGRVGGDAGGEDVAVLVPMTVLREGRELSLFTTVTTFGTARDVTVAELAVELFFPADTATAEALRGSDPA